MTESIPKPRRSLFPILSVALVITQLHGAVEVWEGDDAINPTYFGDANNWANDSGAGFNDYHHYASSAVTKTVEMVNNGGVSLFRSGVQGVNLEGAGWLIQDTVGDGSGGWRYDFNGLAANIGTQPFGINSTGAGINEMAARFQISSTNTPDTGQPTRPITVGIGNTLLFSGDFVDGQGWTLQGDGTMIVDNTNSNGGNNSFNAGIVINDNPTLLNRGSMSISGASEELDSGTIGGDGTFHLRTGALLSFTGTKLAPGGDGSSEGGSEIGALTALADATAGADIAFESGTVLDFQLGSGGVGDNDQFLVDLNVGGDLTISSAVTLSLSGSLVQDGVYTLISDIGDSNAFTGTFDTVLWNGSAANPANFLVNYGDDAITVGVTGLIPEPSSTSILVLGILSMFLRRNRR